MNALRSFLVWLVTWLYMALAGAIAIPVTLLTRRLGFIYGAARFGIRILVALAGIKIIEHGSELLPASGGVLYMPNHQSNLDPPILLLCLPGQVSFLAKRELFRAPVLGTLARVGGLIPLDRGDRAAAEASIAAAAAAIQAGRPFLIFPEGTRSADGRLLEFKKGAFHLAEQAQSPIVPVTIDGTGRLMPKGNWHIHPGAVHVTYHPAINPAGMTREEIAEAVYQAIAGALPAGARI